MIFDSIKNIKRYKDLNPDIYAALIFISGVNVSIENGILQLNDRVKVIVSEYDTKEVNPNGYEAHCKNIDIQFPIRGVERIKCCPIEDLKISKDYDEENDYLLFWDETQS